MENFAQDPLAISIYGGADSGNKLLFPNPMNPFVQAGASSSDLGEIPHALPIPNLFVQAGASSSDLGEIPDHALQIPNLFDQAGVSSADLGDILPALPFPNPFDRGRAYSHSLERENAIDGGVIQVEESCRCFPLDVIKKATNDFDDARVVGTGGFGKVYKGLIYDGATTTVVAIKRLHVQSNQGAEEFWTEVKLLSKFRHTNLVSLIGYCNENQEMILVYQYLALGTLANHLYKSSREESGKIISHLTWAQRLNICLGAARGLDYLHTGTEIRIIHRDVKSTNILLEKNWIAKVSDFGICKCITSQATTHVSTKVKATRGYWDPDYMLTGLVTRKSDVYAFGVVLLEVLCGRPPLDDRLEEEQISLITWAKDHIEKGKLDQIIDPSLNVETTPQSLNHFAKLANDCLHTKPKERPTMSEVVEILQYALALHKREVAEILQNVLVLHERKGRPQKTITKAFQGIQVVPMVMNRWWRKGKDNSSNDGGGPRFSLVELQVATNNFSNKIGKGGFGDVYKGRLADGSLVAVKRQTQGGELRFQTEVEMMFSVPVHRNLLRLRGFCLTPTERLLVHPYMANKSVASCLRERSESQPPLDWPIRKLIALGSARGLAYLHDHCDPKIIHRNVKAASILLDEEFEAVVGDFSLAKLMDYNDTHVTTSCVTGTSGFMAPEYIITGKISEKADVFGYGVMLLELITRRKAYDCPRLANDDDAMLLDWVKGLLKEKKLETLVDADLQGNYIEEEVENLIQVALLCTQGSAMKRPKMSEIVRMLKGDGLAERWEEWQKDGGLAESWEEWLKDKFFCSESKSNSEFESESE